jgi:hypothetical protein
MFMRYLPYLQQHGGKIIVAIHELVRSLYKMPEGIKLLAHGENAPDFQLQCPLMSLPHWLKMSDPPAPPLPMDWYDVDQALLHHWNMHFNLGPQLRVGLVFSGNFGHKHDVDRSIPAEKFHQLTKTKGATFFSLQKDVRPDDIKALNKMPWVSDLGTHFKSFNDTAAALRHLDLVISVDTSVAHLAGSLGVPTWTLLSCHGTDWRWQQKREDSPWYPSMQLLRQERRYDWDTVLNRATRMLVAKVAEKQAA